jgi:hypothetical protein
MTELGAFLTAFVMVVFVLLGAAWLESSSKDDGRHEIRSQAIELGCAEWIVAVDGSTEFKWKDIN